MEVTLEKNKSAELFNFLNNKSDYVDFVEFEIASEDILTLNTTPVVVIPGVPGTVIEFISAILTLVAGDDAYTTQGDLIFQTADEAEPVSETLAGADLLLAADDAVAICPPLGDAVVMVPGDGLAITVGTDDPAAGDGILRGKVMFRRHTIDLE